MAPPDSFWSRLKTARIVRILVVYLAASWLVIEVTATLQDILGLPAWVAPVAFVLLMAGLVVILATAWVQSHPLVDSREEAGEVPDAWDVGLGDLGAAIWQGRLPHLTWGRTLVGGLVVFSLLFGAAGLYVLLEDRGAVGPRPLAAEGSPAPGVAVLPFTVNAPELELWREGMVDMLSRDLDGLGELRGIDSRTVMARWAESVSGDTPPDLATMLDVARRANARWALVGSVVGGGQEVRLDADVYDLETGEKLGTARAEDNASEIMDAVDRLAVDVARVMFGGDASDMPVQHLSSLTTESLPALEAYLEGEAYYRRAEFEAAEASFRRAVIEDSTFALAWVRLHNAVGWTDVGGAEYGRTGDLALRYAHRLPDREAVLVRAQNGLRDGIVDELPALENAARRYPDDPELWAELGEYHVHFAGQLTSSMDSMIDILERAIELDPSFGPYYIHAVDMAIWVGDSTRAARLLEAQRRASPESSYHRGSALAFALAFGDPATRDSAWAEVDAREMGQALTWAQTPLTGLQHTAVREEFVRRIVERGGGLDDALRSSLADRGKLSRLWALVQAESRPADLAFAVPAAILGAAALDVEVPAALEDAFIRSDDPEPLQLMVRAALAVDEETWSEFDAAMSIVEDREREEQAADSLEARRWRGLGEALGAYRTWRGGDRDGAAAALADVRPVVTGWLASASSRWVAPAAVIRWWQARLAVERDRPREALRYYRSLIQAPPLVRSLGVYRQGELHEGLGQLEEARRAYALFTDMWAEADPALQPLVEHARSRLAALTAEDVAS